MKLKIEKEFIDRITSDLHRIGDVIDVDKARGEELLADERKLVSVVESPKRSDKKK